MNILQFVKNFKMIHNSAVNMLHDLHLNNKAGGPFNKAVGACLNKIVVIFEFL